MTPSSWRTRAANDALKLEDEGAERMLQQAMRKLTEERGRLDADGRAWIRVPRAIRALFADADRVTAARFEADVRLLMSQVLYAQKEQAAYSKLCEDALTRLRERLAHADQSPSLRTEIEAEVKRAFKREWLEAEAEMVRTDRTIRFPDY